MKKLPNHENDRAKWMRENVYEPLAFDHYDNYYLYSKDDCIQLDESKLSKLPDIPARGNILDSPANGVFDGNDQNLLERNFFPELPQRMYQYKSYQELGQSMEESPLDPWWL